MGLGNSNDRSPYKAGQNVVCTVKNAEDGGYAVVIKKDNRPGFIKTIEQLKLGSEILAKFVCIYKGRVLLSPIFQENWAVPANKPAGEIFQQLETGYTPFKPGYWLACTVIESEQGGYSVTIKNSEVKGVLQTTRSFQSGSLITAKFTGMLESRAVLKLGAEIHPQVVSEAKPNYSRGEQDITKIIKDKRASRGINYRDRRAVDLIMPPQDEDSLNSLKSFPISHYDLEWLLLDLEGGNRTGVLKTASQSNHSRAAILLYKGRAVGCIYGSKTNPDAKATEESISLALKDLETPDTMVTMYDLPSEAVLAMSALFLGYTLEREDNMDSRSYFNTVMNNFVQNQSTACVVVTIPSTKSTYLAFFGKGQFGGIFSVEEQQFNRDINAIHKLFEANADAQVEVSMLSSESIASGVRFGYSLIMLWKQPPKF